MPEMTKKEFEIQLALGTLSPMRLFLKMLSMQNEDGIKSDDWADERKPKITTGQSTDNDIHIEVSDEVVFVFNSKEEFIGMFNSKW